MITAEVLLKMGFLPGEDGSDEYGWSIWDKTDVMQDPEHDEDQPHHQLVFKLSEQSLWLEAYDAGGESLAITELPSTGFHNLTLLMKLLTHRKDGHGQSLSDQLDRRDL